MTQPDSRHFANVFVAYLRDRIIAIADRKSEREIAEEIGFHNPETIRRIKDGELRLPLDLVGAIAKALEVDAPYLANLWLASHVPDGSDLVEPMMTPNETEILEIIRNVTEHGDPKITEETRHLLEAIFRYTVARS